MLRIYPVILETIRALRPLIAQLERRDSDLARQLRRASASVALTRRRACTRGARTASRGTTPRWARETTAGVEVAGAMGYLREIPPELADHMDHVTGTLVRLVEGGPTT